MSIREIDFWKLFFGNVCWCKGVKSVEVFNNQSIVVIFVEMLPSMSRRVTTTCYDWLYTYVQVYYLSVRWHSYRHIFNHYNTQQRAMIIHSFSQHIPCRIEKCWRGIHTFFIVGTSTPTNTYTPPPLHRHAHKLYTLYIFVKTAKSPSCHTYSIKQQLQWWPLSCLLAKW